MSPTVFSCGRFFFYARERPDARVHVVSGSAEASFRLDPDVVLEQQQGFDDWQLALLEDLVGTHRDAFRELWRQHFGT